VRALIAMAALALSSPALAQQKASPPAPQVADSPAQPLATPPSSSQPAEARQTRLLSDKLARLRDGGERGLPGTDRFIFGDRTIVAGSTVTGPIAVARGNLDVYGTVLGDAIAVDGDVRVHKGARIAGDALAAGGRVIVDGGSVEGEMRSLSGISAFAPMVPAAQPRSTWQTMKLVGGWFAVVMIIGLGVMVFAEGNLDGVVIALERGFARAFWIGVLGQLVMLPTLLLLVAALAITVIGILLIPFAIVAYIVAAAGLVTLGFLAVARLTGRALTSDRGTTSPRGVHLRALFSGICVYFGIWLLAAAFAWHPMIGTVMRAVAIAITWVAATVGLGATLASRAGTQRPGAGARPRAGASDEMAWQTPTPVTGVAASRRPPSPSHSGRDL
jgi:hypothetical protein